MTITLSCINLLYGLVWCCDDTRCHVITIWPILLKLCVYNYICKNLCTMLLVHIYSHVLQSLQWTCACRIQSLHKVVSNLYLFNSLLTTYTQLPTILQKGCVKLVIIQQSPHNLYTVTNNLSTRLCPTCNYSTVCLQPIHNLTTRL